MLKKLKIIAAIITIVMLLCTIPTNIFAETKNEGKPDNKTIEKLVLKAKEVFNIQDKYDDFEVNSSSDDEYGTIYNLSWSIKDGTREVNVSISKDMHIINYNIYENKKYETLKPKYSYKALKKYALDMIKKIDPINSKSLKLNENSYQNFDGENSYTFNFDRYLNGRRVIGDGASITISYVDKSIQRYSLNYTNGFDFAKTADFDALKSNLSLEKAIDIFKENKYLKPIIKFVINDKKDPRVTFKTVYSNEINRNYIVNSTSKKYERYDYPVFRMNNLMAKDAATEDAMDGLSEYEVKGIDKIKGIKTKDEAIKKAKTYVKDADKFKVTLSTLNQDYISKDYIYHINLENGEKDKKTYYNISFDAKDLTLLSFNYYNNYNFNEADKKDLSPNEAKKIAMDFINKNAMDIDEKDLELVSAENNSVNFVRLMDEYYIPENSININISKDTKEVTSYSRAWYRKPIKYEKAKISSDDAYATVKKEVAYEEVYKYVNTVDSPKMLPILCYVPKYNNIEIDAITGKLKNTPEEFRNYSDIDKSKYKDKATLLKQMGYSYLEDEIMPNKNLKQKDFICFMYRYGAKDMDPDEAIDDAYQRAIRDGIIKENEVNKEKDVTMIDLAKFMVRLKGMEELVNKDIFKNLKSKTKLTKEENSYLSLAKALEYVSGNTVNKNAKINRDEFINIIYNYVFK